jgi:hypothetical protein
MECLFARKTEEINAKIKAGHEEIRGHQDKADAEAKARHEQFQQDINDHIEALLEGLRYCGKSTTICMVALQAYSEKSKAGPERRTRWLTSREVWIEWRPRMWKLLRNKQRPQWCGRNSLKRR